MKHLTMQLSPEIYIASQERKKKMLLGMHVICLFAFFAHGITDIYNSNYHIIPIRAIILVLILLSFFRLYKRGHYEKSSYAISFILAITTIGITITSKFDNFSPAFIFPFILGTFSLFSWKKGFLFSIALLIGLTLFVFNYENYLVNSRFLHNDISIFNFLFIFAILLLFAFYYETTRIDAYKRLIDANYKKDLLYKEIHHRVKNNLNIVSSMLAIQAEKEDDKVKDIIKSSKERIDAIAMVHSMLYVSNGIEKVNAKLFIEKLTLTIHSTISSHATILFRIKELELSLNEIIPIGLIINELLTNSFKYAFKDTQNPKIIIVLHIHKNTVTLTYHDNGIGYDTNFEQGIGLKLVDLNVKQLKGNLKINYNHGLNYKMIYKRSLHV